MHVAVKGGSHFVSGATPRKHSLDVFERDFLRLLGGDGGDVHLQGGQPQGYVVFQLRPESLLDHIVTTLRRDQQGAQRVKEWAQALPYWNGGQHPPSLQRQGG